MKFVSVTRNGNTDSLLSGYRLFMQTRGTRNGV